MITSGGLSVQSNPLGGTVLQFGVRVSVKQLAALESNKLGGFLGRVMVAPSLTDSFRENRYTCTWVLLKASNLIARGLLGKMRTCQVFNSAPPW